MRAQNTGVPFPVVRELVDPGVHEDQQRSPGLRQYNANVNCKDLLLSSISQLKCRSPSTSKLSLHAGVALLCPAPYCDDVLRYAAHHAAMTATTRAKLQHVP